MGIFVTEDGQHYRGWLAAFLCCCAAVDDDEHPSEWSRPPSMCYNPQGSLMPRSLQTAASSTRNDRHIYHEQPASTHAPPPYPYSLSQTNLYEGCSTSHNGSKEMLKKPSPPLKPLDLGPSSLMGASLMDENMAKPGIVHPTNSAPSASRRLNHESQRRSLIPLKFAPVTLRRPSSDDEISPLEAHRKNSQHQRSDSTQDLLSSSNDAFNFMLPPESHSLSAETPYQRSHKHSAGVHSYRQGQLAQQLNVDDLQHQQTTFPLSTYSSSNSLQKSTFEDGSSSITSRSSYELPPRIRKKHSGALSTRGDDLDPVVDREGIELNTIHEEHKPESPRPTTAKSESSVHAVAPATSETLNDIGSIFSRPLMLKDSKAFDEALEEPDERRSRSSTQPNKLRSRSTSRVSGWLSSIRTPSAASLTQTHMPEPSSTAASSKTATPARLRTASANSPSLTAASSPTSKSHSRSLTAESRITSPPSTIQEIADDQEWEFGGDRDSAIARTEQQCQDEGWPSLTHSSSQVGLAL